MRIDYYFTSFFFFFFFFFKTCKALLIFYCKKRYRNMKYYYIIIINWAQQPPCFSYVNDVVLMLICTNLHKKSSAVFIKTRSTLQPQFYLKVR